MHKRLKRSGGTSLIEVMIYALLLGIAMTGIYGVLISTMKYYQTVDNRTQLQQNAISAYSNITGDMMGTANSSIITGNSPVGIIFVSSRKSDGNHEIDSGGTVKWQKWVCYYLKQNQFGTFDLFKKEVPIQNPSATIGSCPYSSVSQFAAASLNAHLVAYGVWSMTITKNTATGNYMFDITFDRSDNLNDPKKINRLQVSSEIHVRN